MNLARDFKPPCRHSIRLKELPRNSPTLSFNKSPFSIKLGFCPVYYLQTLSSFHPCRCCNENRPTERSSKFRVHSIKRVRGGALIRIQIGTTTRVQRSIIIIIISISWTITLLRDFPSEFMSKRIMHFPNCSGFSSLCLQPDAGTSPWQSPSYFCSGATKTFILSLAGWLWITHLGNKVY